VNPQTIAPQAEELPLLKAARREALIAFSMWLTATAYSVAYCCTFGYGRKAESLTYVLGFPDWVFWGLVLPWGIFTVAASVFAMCFMTDQDLDTGLPVTAESTGK